MKEKIAAEFRQLPGILGKLVGGLTAISGILAAVLGLGHDAQNSATLGAIALCAGVFLFVRSSRWLEQKAAAAGAARDSKSAPWESALAWGLLACFVAIFLLLVQFATRI